MSLFDLGTSGGVLITGHLKTQLWIWDLLHHSKWQSISEAAKEESNASLPIFIVAVIQSGSRKWCYKYSAVWAFLPLQIQFT